MSTRFNFSRLILLLLSVVWFSLQADSCFAIAREVNSFRFITIEEAPPEIRQEIEITSAESGESLDNIHLKMVGGASGEPGGHLTIVRVEDKHCHDKFCPTYIKYTFNGAGSPLVQALLMQCDEWFINDDTLRPLKSSSGEVVMISLSITVRTKVGEVQVSFTRLGPAVAFIQR